jgi:hypothetical protein
MTVGMLAIFSSFVKAQVGKTEVWKAYSIKYENVEQEDFESEFVFSAENVKWVQAQGSRTYDFRIIGVEGEWNDKQTDGFLLYTVKNEVMNGTIRVERDNGKLGIHIDMNGKNQNTKITCKVSQIRLTQ